MAPHWKCGSRQRVEGSNPSLSARFRRADRLSLDRLSLGGLSLGGLSLDRDSLDAWPTCR
jgi:hypothetical protein